MDWICIRTLHGAREVDGHSMLGTSAKPERLGPGVRGPERTSMAIHVTVEKGTFCCFQSLSLCFTENNLFTSFSLIYLRNRFEHDKREDLLHKHLGQELRYCQLFGFVFMYLFDERMLMPCWGWGVSTMCIPGTEFKLSDVMVSTITTSLHLTVFNILFF